MADDESETEPDDQATEPAPDPEPEAEPVPEAEPSGRSPWKLRMVGPRRRTKRQARSDSTPPDAGSAEEGPGRRSGYLARDFAEAWRLTPEEDDEEAESEASESESEPEWDFAAALSGGSELGDLESGSEAPEEGAERGTVVLDFAEALNSGIEPGDRTEDPDSDPQPGDEAESGEPDAGDSDPAGGDEAPVVERPAIEAPLASAGRRFGGLVLDTLLFVVTGGIGWVLWSLVVWARGQTPAKSLLGMRVAKLDTGRAARWRTMVLREGIGVGILSVVTAGITTLVSSFLILGESRQGVWDRIARTVVVDDRDDRLPS